MAFLVIIGLATNLHAYTKEDWKVYDACKERVYDNKKNSFDYEACKEMLDHKKALRKHGAEGSYKYWIERLENNK